MEARILIAHFIHSINSSSVLTAHTKDNDGLAKALKDADIVVIPAGVPRKVRARPLAAVSASLGHYTNVALL